MDSTGNEMKHVLAVDDFLAKTESVKLENGRQLAFLDFDDRHGQPISYASYVVAVTSPPCPVQFVWKNSPRGLSIRS